MTFKWLDFKITNRCNNNCIYCGVNHDPPSHPEILSLANIQNAIFDAISLGFTHIALLGGEPSIREDIEKVFSTLKKCPQITLMAITNGLVYKERMYNALFNSGAGVAKIVHSFDSFNKSNYKHQDPEKMLKNIDQIHEKAIKCNENGLMREIEIHTVISKENLHNFSDVINYFRIKGIDVSLALVCPSEFKYDNNSNDYNKFNYEELNIILNQLRYLKEKGLLNFANTVLLEYLKKYPYGKLKLKFSCRAGKDHIVINSDGEVYPCISESYRMGIRFGNIRKESFLEIYEKMSKFKCESEFAPACWDHFLWNHLGEHIFKGENK